MRGEEQAAPFVNLDDWIKAHMQRHDPLTLIVAAMVIVASTNRVEAQRTVRDRIACASCRIQATEVARIGDKEGPGAISGPAVLARTGNGSFVVSDPPALFQFRVFDARGVYQRTIGRKGKGPGEFQSIQALVPTPDGRVVVFDNSVGRMTTFSSDFTLIDETPFHHGGISNFFPLPDGAFLINGEIWTSAIRGYPVHIMKDGEVTKSFGVTTPVYRRDRPYLHKRVAAPGRTGVWLITPNSYEIEQWSLDGRRLLTLKREAAWFPPYERGRVPSREEPPLPLVVDAWESPDGLLWVAVSVADPKWATSLEVRGTLQGRPLLQPRSTYEYHDTILEVIDPLQGELLAATRFPGLIRFINREGYLVSFVEDEHGFPYASVLQLALHGPSR